jgi:hypothetical protein
VILLLSKQNVVFLETVVALVVQMLQSEVVSFSFSVTSNVQPMFMQQAAALIFK